MHYVVTIQAKYIVFDRYVRPFILVAVARAYA